MWCVYGSGFFNYWWPSEGPWPNRWCFQALLGFQAVKQMFWKNENGKQVKFCNRGSELFSTGRTTDEWMRSKLWEWDKRFESMWVGSNESKSSTDKKKGQRQVEEALFGVLGNRSQSLIEHNMRNSLNQGHFKWPQWHPLMRAERDSNKPLGPVVYECAEDVGRRTNKQIPESDRER